MIELDFDNNNNELISSVSRYIQIDKQEKSVEES